jgi:hypothetical protein
MLLHEAAWTTSSELTGQIGPVILTFHRTAQSLTPGLQEVLCRCMDFVKQVWLNIEARPTRE